MDTQGHIVTCASVVQDASDIQVGLLSGRSLSAQVLAVDEISDLALLKIDPCFSPLPLSMALQASPLVGHGVIAIGYPFGLSQSISVGMVSAVLPSTNSPTFSAVILSDAAINPGHNGGPLLDLSGRVIGINQVPSPLHTALGHAIPIRVALPIIKALQRGEKPRHAWLGIHVQHIDMSLTKSFGFKGKQGALVNQVLPNSPAHLAGIKKGDIVVSFSGQTIEDPLALIQSIKRSPVNHSQKIRVFRGGRYKTLRVTPTQSPR
jgi:serine protease Do